jgi:hypothetical protein
MKMVSLVGIIVAVAAFCYFAVQETSIGRRASSIRTAETPAYVHERFQRSYFSSADAEHLRRLHHREAAAVVVLAVSWTIFAHSKRRAQCGEPA